MLLLLNSVMVVTIEVNSQALLEALKGLKLLLLLLLPNLLPNKLGITRKIPGRTMAVPKNLGNNNNNLGFLPLALQYFNYGA
jgi:hypothetical protein